MENEYKMRLEDGTEIDVIPKEEVDKIQQETEELKAKLTENEEKLGKLENKDYNWKKLRDMTREEKEQLTEREKMLLEQQEELGKKIEAFGTAQQKSFLDSSLGKWAGNDEELRKKVEYHFKRLSDKAETQEEVDKKVSEAFILATGGRSANPIHKAMAYDSGGRIDVKTNKDFTENELDLAKRFGINAKDLEEYKKRHPEKFI